MTLIATASVVEAYRRMGFAYSRLNARQHKFSHGEETAILHESIGGVGFDAHFLFADAERNGWRDELEESLSSLGDDLRTVPYPEG